MIKKKYISITEIDQKYFSSCKGCPTSCCDGSRFVFLPLILDDFEEVYKKFPIVFSRLDNEWRALILLVDENGKCRYYDGVECTLYEKRPPGCRLYPLTPYYEDLLIDLTCPAVTTEHKTFLASSQHINSNFYHQRLDNFEYKRQVTSNYLGALNNQFETIGEKRGIVYYRYVGETDDRYLRMHFESIRIHTS